MKMNPSKKKVIDAASSLFFQKGFHGTSVRNIAEKASVNVSLISYYFKNKQGLLEYAVTNYYEEYLKRIEETIEKVQSLPAVEQLNEIVRTIIQYKQAKYQLTSFIQRELSLDSIFVREMAVTYIAKENHYLRQIFFRALPKEKGRNDRKEFLLMQFKGMLITPYMMHNEWKDQVVGEASHQAFADKYIRVVQDWIRYLTADERPVSVKNSS